MADYTPNRWILDEIAANRKWMVEMMDGMPTECLTSCAKEIESLRAELAKRTEERDEIRLSYCLLMEAYRGGDGRVTANKLGWGYLFAEDSK